MKKSSRNWSVKEDKLLTQTMLANNGPKKLKWEDVAEIMHVQINCQKTGKQCRERWHNHLAPELNNSSQWTKQQNETLFRKHAQLGNKWAKIATFLKGRTDNCVKNHFYSTLRRGMRKVNNHIHENRKQKEKINSKQKEKGPLKQFKPDVLTKILIVADGDPQQKLNVKNNAQALSKKIKQLLIQVSLGKEHKYDLQAINKVIQFIMEFNKNCKKRKGKKKGSDKTNTAQKQQSQQDQISQNLNQQQNGKKQVQFEEQNEQQVVYKNESNIKQKQKTKEATKNWTKLQKKQQPQIKQKKVQISNSNSNSHVNSHSNSNLNSNSNSKYKVNSSFQQQQIDQQKDEVKSVDLADAPCIYQKPSIWKKNIINKKGSLQSINSLQLGNNPNFACSFYTGGNINNQQPIFKNSGFGLSFHQPEETIPVSRQMFGDSGIGIKKNQALMYFSAVSGTDEKNSFFKLDGDRGVFDAQYFMNNNEQQQKSSANQGFKFRRDCNSPGIFSNSLANGFSAFQNAQKNFIVPNVDINQKSKNIKQQKGKN